MSCDCNSPFGGNTTYGSICRADVPYPSVSHESVPSLIDNLVNALYGQINKSVTGGKVVWNIPCDPNNTASVSSSIPRLAGEGMLCYIMRVFQEFSSGGSDVFSPFLNWTYTGNGSTTTYALTGSTALNPAAYLVYIDGVVQAPSNYTIANNGYLQIVFSTAVPNTSQVVIVCMGSASNGTLDNVTITNTIFAGTSNFAGTSTFTGTTKFPALTNSPLSQLSYSLGIDANKNVIAYAGTETNPNNALVTATGSTTARTLANRFGDVVNVKDFGVVGDGVTDDTAALQAALDYAYNLKGGRVVISSGMRCLINSNNLWIGSNVTLEGPHSKIGKINRPQLDFSNITGALIINPLYSVRIGYNPANGHISNGGSIKGLFVLNKDICVPTTNPFTGDQVLAFIAGYSGTGIILGNATTWINSAPSTGAVSAITIRGVNLLASPVTGNNNTTSFMTAVANAINSNTVTSGYTATSSANKLYITKQDDTLVLGATFTYTGTGLSFGYWTTDDNAVQDCSIVGFDQGIYGNFCARYFIENITGDNTNGIRTTNVYDIGRISNVHFNALISQGASYTGNQYIQSALRSGIGFAFDKGNDGSQAVDSFCFGYQTSWYIESNGVNLLGCAADSFGSAIVAGSKAYHITGDAVDTKLIGCYGCSHDTSFYIDSNYMTTLSGCSGFSYPTNQVWMNNGKVIITGCVFYNGASDAMIKTGASLKYALITGNIFDSSSTAYSLDAASKQKVNIATDNIYNGSGGINETTSQLIKTSTSGNGDVIYAYGGGYKQRYYFANGTPSAPTAANGTLGANIYGAHDGTSFIERAALFRAGVLGTVSTGIVPSGFIWSTTNDSGVNADRLVLDQNGNLVITANNTYNLGNSANGWNSMYVSYGSSSGQTVNWTSGVGSPEGVVTAHIGSLYTNASGSTSTTLYVKTSGTGNTGWTAK